ncbi:MAG TPA: MOSC domain-containing protein, partial [Agitococcus sp.]|nr:MOSC domain-containing protein [Agitococcus sp.]
RRWLLVDEQGKFVTQRQYAQMALLKVHVDNNVLLVNAPNMPTLIATPNYPHEISVSIWQDTVMALTVCEQADVWFSQFLGVNVRLVFFPDYSQRVVDTAWAGEGHQTAFSDGFPILVISQASFDDLSQRWSKTVDWRRFRPNIIVAGDFAPYSEDTWQTLKIGELELDLVKPCSRCVIPSIDPETTVKDSSINKVLAEHRRQADGKVYLGQNAIIRHLPEGFVLAQGQQVEIISKN